MQQIHTNTNGEQHSKARRQHIKEWRVAGKHPSPMLILDEELREVIAGEAVDAAGDPRERKQRMVVP